MKMLEDAAVTSDAHAALPRRNKEPAPLQISAESILQEAFQTLSSAAVSSLNETELSTKLEDLEEIQEFQGRKRAEFEKALRKDYHNARAWLNYANFEYTQHEMARVRSIFERSLDYNKENVQLWVRYAEIELKNKSINHARNVLERAIRILPYVDKVWFYYVQLEESLGNVRGTRSVFDRWLIYEPQPNVYDAYVGMERRNGNNVARVRDIFEKYVVIYPNADTWIKWVNYEAKNGGNDTNTIRQLFTVAIDSLFKLDENHTHAKSDHIKDSSLSTEPHNWKTDVEKVLIRWAEFETLENELERARSLFRFGLNKLPKEHSKKLFESYLNFEKKYGGYDGSDSISLVLLSKRKSAYEESLEASPRDYDLWWVYISLIEELTSGGTNKQELIEAYEKAISNSPVTVQKTSKTTEWRKYVYLWIRYAYFSELVLKDYTKVRDVYSRIINIVPHKQFTFAKLWINYATFEIRQNDLPKARKILGQSIGVTGGGKSKIFKFYISLEKKLKEMDRVRKLYETYLTKFPDKLAVWLEYINLEISLGDYDRARALYDIAIGEPTVNNHLIVWYKFISFVSEYFYDYDYARGIIEKLLELNKSNVKIWIKWALFEVNAPDDKQLAEIIAKQEAEDDNDENDDEEDIEIKVTSQSIEKARQVFEKGLQYFKSVPSLVGERVLLMEAYTQFEKVYGTEKSVEKITNRLPTLIRKRKVYPRGESVDVTKDGDENDGVEEDIEYKFPDDEEKNDLMAKFLLNAQKWKKATSFT